MESDEPAMEDIFQRVVCRGKEMMRRRIIRRRTRRECDEDWLLRVREDFNSWTFCDTDKDFFLIQDRVFNFFYCFNFCNFVAVLSDL